ncbi:MAG: ABC transporter permease [Chloroflexi bacterium]|nr:ABC transporter permease [Chloroflexota bacterium]MYD47724.1 ABC transporter permease [Chloroflexota bacterium]
MQRFIFLRVIQSILAILVISAVVFALARVTGDPVAILLPEDAPDTVVEQVREKWGLDQPIYIQYVRYIGNFVTGDFGEAWAYGGVPITGLIANRLPNTVMLAAFAWIVSAAIALPIGVMVAVKKDSAFDWAGKVVALIGQSAPSFAIGLILMWIFAVILGWLPTSGNDDGFKSIILPGVALGYYNVAAVMRLTRSSMLEVLDTEYVKLARIKGMPEWKVIWKHCFRNALIVPFTYMGLIGAILLTGSVVIETVFVWPGLGDLAIDAIRNRDFPVIQSIVILFAACYIFINLLVDVMYAYLNPRIRY